MLDRSPDPYHSNPFIPTRQLPFTYPLKYLALALKATAPVKIVALGSSSTAGRDKVLPYPCRLERMLRVSYDQKPEPNNFPILNVLNRGRGGEDARNENDRLERDVIGENPVMVIWQVGTNEPWKNVPFEPIRKAITDGVTRLQQQPLDLILMDPQYVPALTAPDEFRERTEAMQKLIAEIANDRKVNVFGRYELMRGWHLDEKVSFDNIIDMEDPDRLHQGDWSTQRVAWELWKLITDSVDEIWKAQAAAAASSGSGGASSTVSPKPPSPQVKPQQANKPPQASKASQLKPGGRRSKQRL